MAMTCQNDHACNAWCTQETHVHVVLVHPKYQSEAAILTPCRPWLPAPPRAPQL